jgi:hypothetical protein
MLFHVLHQGLSGLPPSFQRYFRFGHIPHSDCLSDRIADLDKQALALFAFRRLSRAI